MQKAVVFILLVQAAVFAYDDTLKRDLIQEIEKRENTINDISYTVIREDFDKETDDKLYVTKTEWKSKDELWYYTHTYYRNGELNQNYTTLYDGHNTKHLNQKEPSKMRGSVKKENTKRDSQGFNGEQYYLKFARRYISEILEEKDFKITKTLNDLYRLDVNYSENVNVTFLVDPAKNFYPLKIVAWDKSKGYTFEKPAFCYETVELQQINGFWMPKKAFFNSPAMNSSGGLKNKLESITYFKNVKVNSGLTKEDFQMDWPDGVKIHDYNLDIEYFSDQADRVENKSLEWIQEYNSNAPAKEKIPFSTTKGKACQVRQQPADKHRSCKVTDDCNKPAEAKSEPEQNLHRFPANWLLLLLIPAGIIGGIFISKRQCKDTK